MKYRNQDGGDNLFAFIEHQQKARQAQRATGIGKLSSIIDWEAFRGDLEDVLGYLKRNKAKGGRPPFDPVFMFKVLVLQKFHGLSDASVEEQIADRFSFMEFLGLRPGDAIPDGNTVWDFREALDRDERKGSERLFARFDSMLEAHGLIGHEGSIIDASFLDAPRQRNTRNKTRRSRKVSVPRDSRKIRRKENRKTARQDGRKRTTRPTTGSRTMQK